MVKRLYAPNVVLLAVLAMAASACATKSVSRIDPSSVTDLSGRWNDTDSRLVANTLIEQSLNEAWARRFAEAHGGEASVQSKEGEGATFRVTLPM